jgi:hypothetical protein
LTPDDFDEDDAPPYVVDSSDGRHIEGYMWNVSTKIVRL